MLFSLSVKTPRILTKAIGDHDREGRYNVVVVQLPRRLVRVGENTALTSLAFYSTEPTFTTEAFFTNEAVARSGGQMTLYPRGPASRYWKIGITR